MGKIGKVRMQLQSDGSRENRETLDFSIDLNVDADGYFTTYLPEHIVAMFKKNNINVKSNTRRNSKDGFYSNTTKAGLLEAIKQDCEECVSRQLVEEKVVLIYVIKTTCSYCVNDANEIVPNGRWLGNKYATKPKYNWRNGTVQSHASSPEPYSVALFVEPKIKRSYKYRSGKVKHEFDLVNNTTPGEEIIKGLICGEHLHWLAEVCSQCPPDGQKTEEIEYTEIIAFFFVNFIKGICKMNETLVHLVNPDNVRKLAETQNFKLLN